MSDSERLTRRRHQWIALRGTPVVEGQPCGWLLTDAVRLVNCPKCGAAAGFYCERPSGRLAWPTHGERTRVLAEQRPDAIEAATGPRSSQQNDG